MNSVQPRAVDGAGRTLNPRDCVVPIMKEIGKGRLLIVGTGFYISRYGLFMSAHHVMETLIDDSKTKLGVGYVCHLGEGNAVHLRRILRAGLLHPADLAVGQADNYVNKYPENPLANKRVRLTARVPEPGSRLITYAYPENEVLDFTVENRTPVVTSDFFEGSFLRNVINSEHPYMPYPYFETTIALKSGASGGPVFDSSGKVIGVNCRGWDFAGAEHEGDNLSSIVPIRAALDLRVKLDQLPPNSWERAQIPDNRDGTTFTIAELGGYGHIDFDLQVS